MLDSPFVDKSHEKEKVFEALVTQALEREDKDTLVFLFKSGTAPTEDNLLSALMQSLDLNQDVKLRRLLTVAFDDSHSYTKELMSVIQHQFKLDDVIKLRTKEGYTVAHLAALCGNLEYLQDIREKEKSLLETKNNVGATAIHYAALNGHFEVVEWLVEEDKQNDQRRLLGSRAQGKTALMFAVEKCHGEVVELLSTYQEELDALTSILAYSENIKEIIQSSRSQGEKRKKTNEEQKGNQKKIMDRMQLGVF